MRVGRIPTARRLSLGDGLPACAVPVGLGDDGLPVSVQLLGLRGRDGAVLAAAEAVQGLVAFDAGPPALVGSRAAGAGPLGA